MPCIDGYTQLRMEDGTQKGVAAIVRGDRVATGAGGAATVLCVVEYPITRTTSLVQMPTGLLLSPWHPVRRADAEHWTFPLEMPDGMTVRSDASGMMYDLVLEGGGAVQAENFEILTLGHGLTGKPALEHPFFGTSAVLEMLAQQPGWDTGRVQLDWTAFRRDSETGYICGYGEEAAASAI